MDWYNQLMDRGPVGEPIWMGLTTISAGNIFLCFVALVGLAYAFTSDRSD